MPVGPTLSPSRAQCPISQPKRSPLVRPGPPQRMASILKLKPRPLEPRPHQPSAHIPQWPPRHPEFHNPRLFGLSHVRTWRASCFSSIYLLSHRSSTCEASKIPRQRLFFAHHLGVPKHFVYWVGWRWSFSRMRSEGFPFIVGGLGVGAVFAWLASSRRLSSSLVVVSSSSRLKFAAIGGSFCK